MSEKNNIALARSFYNSLWQEFYWLTNIEFDAARISNNPQTASIVKAVRRQMQGLSIVKIEVYDLTGKTVFSTDKTQIGQYKSKSSGFLAAKSGQVVTKLDRRDSFKAVSGDLNNIHLISSYLPIYSRDVTIREREKANFKHQSQHDTVTELPKRRIITCQLSDAIAKAQQNSYLLAVMFVDLERFKIINDTFRSLSRRSLVKSRKKT